MGGSSARQLYGGVKGDLLQDDLCHTPCLPGLMQPEPLSLWQATADQYLHRRHSNAQSFLGLLVLMRTKFCLSPLSISDAYEV